MAKVVHLSWNLHFLFSTSETHKIWVHHRLINLNFSIKDKGSVRKPSEVKASMDLNKSLFKLGEGRQILMSAENRD